LMPLGASARQACANAVAADTRHRENGRSFMRDARARRGEIFSIQCSVSARTRASPLNTELFCYSCGIRGDRATDDRAA
jgi:hypothetical protein